jgi:apolipoprotein D and lipocalin family protein
VKLGRLNYHSAMRRFSVFASVAALTLTGLATADLPPLPSLTQPVDLDRYAGDWFVHGAIPLRIPFFSDAEARNYTERYERLNPETIRMTSAFETPNAKRRSFSFKGSVIDQKLNATWSIGFVWPIRAEYSIIYLDDGYNTTVVASPNRKYAWIMSREPRMSDMHYAEMMEFMAAAGFDPEAFRKVPHDDAQPPAEFIQL